MKDLVIVKIPSLGGISIAPALQRGAEIKLGRKEEQEIQHFWDEAERKIAALNLDWSKSRIYQEGLPLTRPELLIEIINKSAQSSRNYQIIKKLIDKGARIEGTEDPHLLQVEQGFFKEFIEAKSEDEKRKAVEDYRRVKADLRARRKLFISEMIKTTLLEGETGILFIAVDHVINLDNLPKDITIKIL